MESNIFNQEIITNIIKAIKPKFLSKDEANNFVEGRKLTVLSESGSQTKGSGIYPPGTTVLIHTGEDLANGWYGIEWFECTSSDGSITTSNDLKMKIVDKEDPNIPTTFNGYYKFIMPDCDLTIKGRRNELFSSPNGNDIAPTEFLKTQFSLLGTGFTIPTINPNTNNAITAITDNAFEYCKELEYITIPPGYTHIGYKSFLACYGLKKVTMSDEITIIGGYAFYSCKSLTEFTLPKDLLVLNEFTFSNCTSLESVTINDKLDTIGLQAFSACFYLREVNISLKSYISTVGDRAFAYCHSLVTISIFPRINNTLTSIDSGAFLECWSLEYILVSVPTNGIPGAPWGAVNATVEWL